MNSNIVISKNTDGRKVLGQKSSKGIENNLDKLISYDLKYTHKVFNIKHVENLLNIDYINLNPSDYIRIFKFFNKNFYYDQRIYYSLYKTLYHKIPYLNIDELVQLIDYTTSFAHFERDISESYIDAKIKDSELNTQTDCSDVTIFDDTNIEIYELLKDILKEITETIHNKLKDSINKTWDDVFNIYTRCLHSVNRLSFINPWKTVLHLSNEITSQLCNYINISDPLESKIFARTQISSSLDSVCDTLSLNCLQKICNRISSEKYKIDLNTKISSLHLSIIDDNESLLSCYSKGDIQILNYILNYYDGIHLDLYDNIKLEDIGELQQLCNLWNNIIKVYTHLSNKYTDNEVNVDYNTHMSIYYKIFYSSKFLKDVDNQIFNNKYNIESVYNDLRESIPRFFIRHKYKLSPKYQAMLLSILSERYGLKRSDNIKLNKAPLSKLEDEFNIIHIMRETIVDISKSYELSILDCLNVMESLYNSFGYVHHYATKKMMDRIFKEYPKNKIESLVILSALLFTSNIPSAVVNTEDTNIKMFLNSIKHDCKSIGYNLSNVVNNRNRPISKSSGLCEFDKVFRNTHNMNIYKMCNISYVGKDIFKYVKRFKHISI